MCFVCMTVGRNSIFVSQKIVCDRGGCQLGILLSFGSISLPFLGYPLLQRHQKRCYHIEFISIHGKILSSTFLMLCL